ncbi:MAG: hypothetical protein J1E02_06705 [Coprobacter sp.]|nr:hypothetical protein [Coprobacter sp.]
MYDNIPDIIAENRRRLDTFSRPYDQVTGQGSTALPRSEVHIDELGGPLWLPDDMLRQHHWVDRLCRCRSLHTFLRDELGLAPGPDTLEQLTRQLFALRIRYDFEFWAATCVTIKDKLSGSDIPLFLNYPQRRLLALLEHDRRQRKPIRIILLKARQWGGSTLTQTYMAWMQLVHRTGWNSVICAHLKDAAANIKGMYAKLLENYPDFLSDGNPVRFEPFQQMHNTSILRATRCKVTIGSAETPNSIRGTDIAMAHLSEVAFWPNTKEKRSTDLIRSVAATIPLVPDTIVVLESTANGTGDYFHTEYTLARKGQSDKTPLFIPWYEIEMYRLPVPDSEALIRQFTPYDRYLWEAGATLEAIAWYRQKRKEYQQPADMMAEYPSNETEAFAHSGERVFDPERIQALRNGCTPPLATGELQPDPPCTTGPDALRNLTFLPDTTGHLFLWAYPGENRTRRRYIVSVDIGGRSRSADYSVITVIDRQPLLTGGVPEIAATWRGHTDHDLLVWKAAQIATWYHRALLVFESNTLEAENSDGLHDQFILETLAGIYPNLYARTPADPNSTGTVRYGFHTNRSTKTLLIDYLVMLLREGGYIERDTRVCDEYDTYEKKANGSFGAIDGRHDDLLMSRAIGLYVACTWAPPAPAEPPRRQRPPTLSEATL